MRKLLVLQTVGGDSRQDTRQECGERWRRRRESGGILLGLEVEPGGRWSRSVGRRRKSPRDRGQPEIGDVPGPSRPVL